MASFIFWSLLTMVVLAPLPLGSNRPWAWSLIAALVGVLMMLWSLGAARSATLAPMRWPRHVFVTAPFLLLAAWFLLQSSTLVPRAFVDPIWAAAEAALGRPLAGAVSLDPAASREGAMRFIAYGGVFWLAMQLGHDAKRARMLYWTIAISGALYAVYGLVVQFGGYRTVLWFDKWAYWDSLTSTFVNRNSYAAYAGLGLIVSLALLVQVMRESGAFNIVSRTGLIYFSEQVRPGFFFLSITCVVLATALVLSQSRGGLAFTCLGIGVLVASLAAAGAIRLVSAGAITLALLGLGVVVMFYSGEKILGRILEAEGGTGRGPVHALARRAIEDGPIGGRGLDTFAHVFQLYRDANMPWALPTHDKAHSLYLEMAVEGGPLALALLLLLFACIVAVLVRGIRIRRRRVIYACGALAATALLGGHAIIDFSVQIPAVAVTFAALLGVGYAQSFRTQDGPRRRHREFSEPEEPARLVWPVRASAPPQIGAQEISQERGIVIDHRPHRAEPPGALGGIGERKRGM